MSARYTWLLLAVLALTATAASCKHSQAACENSLQCADGFRCGDRGVCENIPESAADAGAPCPSTHRCLPVVPSGWMGPVVGTQAGDLLDLAACPSDYDAEVSVVYSDLIVEGECSCSCGSTSDFECSGATIRTHSSCGTCLGCNSTTVPANSCTGIPDIMLDKAKIAVNSYGKVTSSASTCSQPSESNDLSAGFARAERYCEASSLDASCSAEGELCLPDIDSSYSATCIYQTGDLACPAAYPEKETRYAGYDDQRTCSSCECLGPAVGTNCGGIASFGALGDSTCSFTTTITGGATGGACPDLPAGSGFAQYIPNSELPCLAAGAELSGEATTTGTTTFCCLAPIAAP